ncbi:DUF4865 family protein [Rouxiella badensis]|jgi:hypothetical protein|uniref:DUF4865 domain-containing protein n=1 Tax=Rouxiella badensis TaxID=1646377 RepID=A0A1X0WIF7_9GAMM|nr:DUF4865 family protein [Rouxiella badensis]MCC3704028.1 DUF4865 family protein [Rouxiella badensis]MCC3748602.1 DUF4865 family protein [Rouxiella badensis]ORJ26566.1 DUF4865 domain-containing protein [Rouxiella badensis]QII38020.1 DUF4865 family protein [Rouxiella badensis]QOI56111.1 DUF4865 family protein [Rouxiella badensis subsp. acadiensis]
MLAMQYSFTFPADYDMAIIERRIAENGHRLDGFPGLLFKAYLYARRSAPQTAGRENLYAPFYLWQDAESMHRFLLSDGFKALTEAFGWPTVRVTPVLATALSAEIGEARFVSRVIKTIEPYSILPEWQISPPLEGALARVVAWDTQHWQLIRFALWKNAPENIQQDEHYYQVGHISLP